MTVTFDVGFASFTSNTGALRSSSSLELCVLIFQQYPVLYVSFPHPKLLKFSLDSTETVSINESCREVAPIILMGIISIPRFVSWLLKWVVASLNSASIVFLEAKASDPKLAGILEGYHRQGLTSNKLISELLASEHQIDMRYFNSFHWPK